MSGLYVAGKLKQMARAYGNISLFKAYLDITLEYNAHNSKQSGLHSELQSAGISLTHCPHNGKKDVADKVIIGRRCFAIVC